MQGKDSAKLFLAVVVVAVVFVWLSSQSLPPVVASHFGASGAANGFMSRSAYTWFMAGIIAVVPSLLVLLPNLAMSRPRAQFNLPNKNYWLAPERRQETVEYLCGTSRRFGYSLVGFMAYVHWLVVKANAVHPPTLSNEWFVGGLVLLVLAAGGLVVGIFRRFGRASR